MGWCRACRVRTSASVVPSCTRRRGGSYGLLFVCCAGTGELPHRVTYVVGHENASVREGGRRRRSSQRPGCNGLDTVKVRQAWCTGPAEHTRTWGTFTKGSLCATSDLRALAGSLHRRAVSNHHAGKRSALKGARSVWKGGKTVKSYLSLPAAAGPGARKETAGECRVCSAPQGEWHVHHDGQRPQCTRACREPRCGALQGVLS